MHNGEKVVCEAGDSTLKIGVVSISELSTMRRRLYAKRGDSTLKIKVVSISELSTMLRNAPKPAG